MLDFIKTWTLPIAMTTGALVYLIFAGLPVLNPIKPAIYSIIDIVTPALIFIMLFLTFCRVSLKEFHIKKWHFILLMIQIGGSIAGYLIFLPLNKVIAQAAMICFICPTATAAAVITDKLGGSIANLITYTLLSNIMASIIVPVMFPLVEPSEGITFLKAASVVLWKIFILLICPFLLAMIVRNFIKKLHAVLIKYRDLPFYLWALSLSIVTGETVRSLVHSSSNILIEISICVVALVVCCIQFWLGRRIGKKHNDVISAGQALGQKNTILAIWMAYTYLNPLSSLGPGSYVLWQNTINSWQLWKKKKSDKNRYVGIH